jgi:hypothetical protein
VIEEREKADRVGTAGKEKRREGGAGTGKHRGNRNGNGLIESETKEAPGGKPERVGTKEASAL